MEKANGKAHGGKKVPALQMTVEELKASASLLGYELRKKGVKREKHNEVDADGNPVKNCYFPHLAITASCYARTWKLLENARKVFGYEPPKNGKPATSEKDAKEESRAVGTMNGEVWEQKLLLGCEHIVRYLMHDIGSKEMRESIDKLVKPLPKDEYIKRGGKKKCAAEVRG